MIIFLLLNSQTRIGLEAGVKREQVFHLLEQEWQAFLAAFESLPDSVLLEPGVVGEWSVRDVLAHITTWEEEVLKALPAILRGELLPQYAQYGGIDAFNAREQERKRHLSLSQVRRELATTHQRLLSFLSDVPEKAYAGSRFLRRLRLDTYDHYREHAAQILAWRRQRGL